MSDQNKPDEGDTPDIVITHKDSERIDAQRDDTLAQSTYEDAWMYWDSGFEENDPSVPTCVHEVGYEAARFLDFWDEGWRERYMQEKEATKAKVIAEANSALAANENALLEAFLGDETK